MPSLNGFAAGRLWLIVTKSFQALNTVILSTITAVLASEAENSNLTSVVLAGVLNLS